MHTQDWKHTKYIQTSDQVSSSVYSINIVKTTTQPQHKPTTTPKQLNPNESWFDTIIGLHHHHHLPPPTTYHQPSHYKELYFQP